MIDAASSSPRNAMGPLRATCGPTCSTSSYARERGRCRRGDSPRARGAAPRLPVRRPQLRRRRPAPGEAGYRVIVPYLRGHGPTRFLDPATMRPGSRRPWELTSSPCSTHSASQRRSSPATTGEGEPRASSPLSGPTGSRASCQRQRLSHPGHRCRRAPAPARDLRQGSGTSTTSPPNAAAPASRLTAKEIAEVIWRRNSPAWAFDEATLDRAAAAFANPDYVDVVIHSYRHRLGQAPGDGGVRRHRAAAGPDTVDQRAHHHARRPGRRQLPRHRGPSGRAPFPGATVPPTSRVGRAQPATGGPCCLRPSRSRREGPRAHRRGAPADLGRQ